jgi:hypothetical protein
MAGAEASPPALSLTASWLLQLQQGRSTLGKVLGEMKISTTKKQVLQSIAGAFPCHAVLRGSTSGARCPLLSAHSVATLQRRRATSNVSVLHSRRPGSGPTTTWPRGCGKAFRTPPKGEPSLQSRWWRGSRACLNRESRLKLGSGPGMRWTTCIWKVRRCKPTPTWQLNGKGQMPGR